MRDDAATTPGPADHLPQSQQEVFTTIADRLEAAGSQARRLIGNAACAVGTGSSCASAFVWPPPPEALAEAGAAVKRLYESADHLLLCGPTDVTVRSHNQLSA